MCPVCVFLSLVRSFTGWPITALFFHSQNGCDEMHKYGESFNEIGNRTGRAGARAVCCSGNALLASSACIQLPTVYQFGNGGGRASSFFSPSRVFLRSQRAENSTSDSLPYIRLGFLRVIITAAFDVHLRIFCPILSSLTVLRFTCNCVSA